MRCVSFDANHPVHQNPATPKTKPYPRSYHTLNPNQTDLLVTPDPAAGWFLANDGYEVDQGLMVPHPEYALPVGTPDGDFSVEGAVLTRAFGNATVVVDLRARNATIVMGAR